MNCKPWTLICCLIMLVEVCARAQESDMIEHELAKLTSQLPFPMPRIVVPTFPDRVINVVDHGAVGDGHTMNTGAIADAIEACVKSGGGTVVIPPGTWRTGPIKLESNVNLHIERGALVQFSRRLEDFPLIPGLDGKSKRFIITPPIHAYRATNIAISGEGIIDGAGEVWRYVKKSKQTAGEWKELVSSGGVVSQDGEEWWPSEEAMGGEKYLKQLEASGATLTAEDYAKTREFLRPDLVLFVQCRNILFNGTTFQNSPRYHIHPVQSENLIVRRVKVFSPWFGQNNDGIDPSSCRNAVIYDCTVDVGDDGICLKPGSVASSQKPGPACENIVVDGCVVYRAHGGFVIGSESYGGANNVSVHDCVFSGTDVGVRFKSLRGRGGVVENVFIDGIQMRNIVNEALLFDMYYGGGAPEVESTKDRTARQTEPVNARTPRFQKISIKNVVCNGAERAALISGLPEMPIRKISLSNVSIDANKGALCVDADSVQFTDCRFVTRSSPVIGVISGKNIAVQGGSFPGEADLFLKVDGEESAGVNIIGVTLARSMKPFELGKNVRTDAVRAMK